MANIIDYTWFEKGPLHLPAATNTEGRVVLLDFITRYEAGYLGLAMGYELRKAFLEGLAVTPTVAPKWLELRDGLEFTYDDRLYKWGGVGEAIARYVYFKYLQYTSQPISAVGVTVPKVNNAISIGPGRKMVDAWNEMVYRTQELRWFVDWRTVDFYPAIEGRSEVLKTINELGI